MMKVLLNRTGKFLGEVHLTDKYSIDWYHSVIESDRIRLINQLWKLVPMRENEEDWRQHLNTVIEELSGLVKIYKNKVEGLILLSKLEGLTSKPCEDFMIYRKTVFKCIDLFSRMMSDE